LLARYSQTDVGVGPSLVVVVVLVSLGSPGNLDVKPSPGRAKTIQPASAGATVGEGVCVGAGVGVAAGVGAAVWAGEEHAENRRELPSAIRSRRRTRRSLASLFK
jgi:hypothetical protein